MIFLQAPCQYSQGFQLQHTAVQWFSRFNFFFSIYEYLPYFIHLFSQYFFIRYSFDLCLLFFSPNNMFIVPMNNRRIIDMMLKHLGVYKIFLLRLTAVITGLKVGENLSRYTFRLAQFEIALWYQRLKDEKRVNGFKLNHFSIRYNFIF